VFLEFGKGDLEYLTSQGVLERGIAALSQGGAYTIDLVTNQMKLASAYIGIYAETALFSESSIAFESIERADGMIALTPHRYVAVAHNNLGKLVYFGRGRM